MEERPIPKQVQKRLSGWFYTFWGFTICHYLFGIGGVLASTIAASAADDSDLTRKAGIAAAVCFATLGFLKPDEKYRKHVIAWRLLDEKVNQYRFNLIEIKELLEAMAYAERTLDQMERENGTFGPVPTREKSYVPETPDSIGKAKDPPLITRETELIQ